MPSYMEWDGYCRMWERLCRFNLRFLHFWSRQGICGTMMSELSHPEFNPGTLNQRRRQRELGRIDRDNLALMHRIERASSSYNRTLIKPKHFQEPHMGLFPRYVCTIRSGCICLAVEGRQRR